MFFLQLPSGVFVHSYSRHQRVITRSPFTISAISFKTEKSATSWINKHLPITLLKGLAGVKIVHESALLDSCNDTALLV